MDTGENNLNNFYNKIQRFARILPLRGPCRLKAACCETTKYNASPWTRFLLSVLAKRCIMLFTLQQDCITREARRLLLVVKVVFVVFPNSAGIVSPQALCIVVYLAAGLIGNSTNSITRFSGRTVFISITIYLYYYGQEADEASGQVAGGKNGALDFLT